MRALAHTLTSYSTGLDPAGWREHWHIHGISWQALIELHLKICDRLCAHSSPWEVSS